MCVVMKHYIIKALAHLKIQILNRGKPNEDLKRVTSVYFLTCMKVVSGEDLTRPTAACTISRTASVWESFKATSTRLYTVVVVSVLYSSYRVWYRTKLQPNARQQL